MMYSTDLLQEVSLSEVECEESRLKPIAMMLLEDSQKPMIATIINWNLAMMILEDSSQKTNLEVW